MTSLHPLRLAILATHPIQYQAPVWRALASRPDVEIRVFFSCDIGARTYRDAEFNREIKWDVPITAGYSFVFLSSDPRLQQVTTWRPGAHGLLRHLRAYAPGVVLLNAYGGRFWMEALLAARLLGLPVILRHEASDVAVNRSPFRAIVRDLVLRLFYGQITAFAAIGTRAREHLGRFRIPSRAITAAPYNVDSALFVNEAQRWLPEREALRASQGIAPADVVFVFSGKLIPKKDPFLVLQAIQRLSTTEQSRIHWMVLGDGELRESLRGAARALLGGRAHFPGFINQRALGSWYAQADCLVLPSRAGQGETWGLVVNEAFHYGLPAIVSDGVGCQPDLVPDRGTGWVFESGKVDSLANALREILHELPAARTHYAEMTKARIALFTTERAAAGIAQAAALACAQTQSTRA